MSRKQKQVTITVATPTTPAMSSVGATEKERQHLSPAEFGQQLSILSQEVKDLVKIARKVGHLKAGAHLKLANGENLGVKELNALVSRHNRTLKQLKKNYTARGSRKKRSLLTKDGQVRKVGKGFGIGSFLDVPLVNFLKTANFGTVNGKAGGGQSIREVIAPLVERGVLNRSILTVLLTLYSFANGHRFEADDKKYFRAGPEMTQFLGPYLTQLEASDRALSDADLVDAKGNPKMRFDRNKFVYNRLQSIVQPGIFSNKDLDEERKAYIENPAVVESLRQIQAVVSNALKNEKTGWNPTKAK